jgi:hypothetical protein
MGVGRAGGRDAAPAATPQTESLRFGGRRQETARCQRGTLRQFHGEMFGGHRLPIGMHGTMLRV